MRIIRELSSENFEWELSFENYEWELSSENYDPVYNHAEKLRIIGILAYPKTCILSFKNQAKAFFIYSFSFSFYIKLISLMQETIYVKLSWYAVYQK